jgi:hypothetical protein
MMMMGLRRMISEELNRLLLLTIHSFLLLFLFLSGADTIDYSVVLGDTDYAYSHCCIA